MSDRTISRLRATAVAVAPVALAAALLWHPHIPGRLPNETAIGDAAAAGTTRWGLAHLAAAVASALVMLAFVAIRSYLVEAGEKRWSILGLPFIVMGSTLFAVLPGMEFTPLAAVKVGTDPRAAQAAIESWFVPVGVIGGILFALGILAFSRAIADSGVLRPVMSGLVIAALIVMAASRLVPFAAGQFYVQSAAVLIALWPLAYRMWTQASEA
jgi:hypothetical protein